MTAMISVELVPRSRPSIVREIAALEERFSNVEMINVPDLVRFDLRSWEACALGVGRFERVVPHIRAMDFPSKQAGYVASLLRDHGISEALVVRGDSPQDLSRPVYGTSSADLIRALKDVDPSLKLHAVFDPYRQGLQAELDDVREKVRAGVDGLFTQPFFDLRLVDFFADVLPAVEIFWGVSPVISQKSRRYWEVKNGALFPSNFIPSMEWNRNLAEQFLS